MNDISKLTIYHNPHCSKCQIALATLEEQGIEATMVEYLKAPPSASELDDILTKLALQPRELMRQHEAAYQQQGLDNPDLSRAQLIEAMVANPILIQRPIMVREDRAVVARSPESIQSIL